MRSGLLSLAVAISEMMSTGPIADAIGEAARLIEAVSRNLIAWLEIEADLLRPDSILKPGGPRRNSMQICRSEKGACCQVRCLLG